MDYGDNMKPTKFKVVHPGTDLGRFQGDTFWGGVMMKLKKLGTAIEMAKGPKMNIDDHDYRWVDDKIEYMEQAGRQLTKDDMERANELWRIYG